MQLVRGQEKAEAGSEASTTARHHHGRGGARGDEIHGQRQEAAQVAGPGDQVHVRVRRRQASGIHRHQGRRADGGGPV